MTVTSVTAKERGEFEATNAIKWRKLEENRGHAQMKMIAYSEGVHDDHG